MVLRKLRFSDFLTTAQDDGRLSAFTTRKYSWYSFLLEAESTPGPQYDRKDFMSMKNPLIPAGIEPTTFRFVAQYPNHCATAVPYLMGKEVISLGENGREVDHSPLSCADVKAV